MEDRENLRIEGDENIDKSDYYLLTFHEKLQKYMGEHGLEKPKNSELCFRINRLETFLDAGACELFYLADDLPLLFEDGVVVSHECHSTGKELAFEVSENIASIRDKKSTVFKSWKDMQKFIDKKMKDHEIKNYELTAYGVEKGKATGILDLVVLNNAGLPRNKSYFICQPQYETKWKIPDELKEHLKGQAARKNMEQPGRLKIDALSAKLITEMSPKDVENIVAYISSDYAGIDSRQGYREYVQSGGEPFLVPPGLRTIYVKDGIVRTKIDLSSDVEIEDCVVKTAKVNLPESVIIGIKGKSARSVIEHPFIPEEAVATEIKFRGNKMLIPLQMPYVFIDSLLSYHKNNPNPYDSDSQQVIMARDALRKSIIKVG